jgi:hypothetical protein
LFSSFPYLRATKTDKAAARQINRLKSVVFAANTPVPKSPTPAEFITREATPQAPTQADFIAPEATLKSPTHAELITPQSTLGVRTSRYLNFEQNLALQPHPTLLYTAPSHTGFITASYLSAAFCFTYVAYNSGALYLDPPGLSWFVPYMLGGCYLFMSAAGGWFMLGPAGIVKSITAMPFATLQAVGASTKGLKPSDMRVEVVFRRLFPLPYMPARKLYVRAKDIKMAHKLAPRHARTPQEIRALEKMQEEARQKALEYERANSLSKGLKNSSRFFFELFQGTKRMFTRSGFAKIYIKDFRYKLDVSGGWALDGGKVLDRLMSTKHDD